MGMEVAYVVEEKRRRLSRQHREREREREMSGMGSRQGRKGKKRV